MMIVMKIQDFIDFDTYTEEIEYMVEWVKSSNRLPGVDEIYVPGEFEAYSRAQRLKEGIPIEEKTWARLVEIAESYDVALPEV